MRLARTAGYTLVEVLIVVVILGILATLVVPQMSEGSAKARQEVFVKNLRYLISAATMHYEKHGKLPDQGAGDPLPLELFDEIKSDGGEFDIETPLGGYWHIGKLDINGTERWGVGIWWPTEDEDDVAAKIDAAEEEFDDGDRQTGKFQRRGQQYYWLIN